jgi:hypothetical protein
MSYDDDPYNNGDGNDWRSILKVVVVIVILGFVTYMLLGFLHRAFGQSYLPPRQYTQPVQPPAESDPIEYYAEDWVVLDQADKPICRDPYIKRDIHVIKCVGRDPIR